MELKDYCNNVIAELTGWKAKVYDIVRRFDKVSTGDKTKVVGQIKDLHILMGELEERIARLRRDCPNAWSPDQMDIDKKLSLVKAMVAQMYRDMPK